MKALSICFALLLSALVILSLSSSSLQASSAQVNIFPPGSKPYGLSYEEHIKNWWKWQTSIPTQPEGEHPIEDKTGEKCTKGQLDSNSSVFYLSGSGGATVQRTCEIPAGKSILIPVMTEIATDKEADYKGYTIKQLNDVARNDQNNVVTLSLNINGREYTFDDLKKFRTHTGDFVVVYPKYAIFGASEGPSKAVADGYYVITEPLPKGTYSIHYKGTITDPTSTPPINYSPDIKYTLIVK